MSKKEVTKKEIIKSFYDMCLNCVFCLGQLSEKEKTEDLTLQIIYEFLNLMNSWREDCEKIKKDLEGLYKIS